MQVTHSLGREEAARRIKEQLGTASAEVTDFEEQWQGYTMTFRCKAHGFAVSGTVIVEDTDVQLDATLPLAAVMFKSVIEQCLRQQVDDILK